MAKMLKLNTTERFNAIVDGFAAWLKSQKLTDGKVRFNTDLGKVDRKATLTFMDAAWMKMQYLIFRTNTNEVGWRMVVKRSETEEDDYVVEDILVYPQTVAGATVTTDQKEYEDWTKTLTDEQYNNLHGHGHSHVKMGVTPSSTDLTHQDEILKDLADTEGFYVFCIFNQLGNQHITIFDFKKNVMFENSDVEVLVDGDGEFFDFIEDADKKIETKKYTAATTYKPATTVTPAKQQTSAGTHCKVSDSRSIWGSAYDYDDYDDPLRDSWGVIR